ncbi:MAG: hypothetical protein BME93_03375 [Methanosarcinales archaeon Met12]|nr:MAG: hypothetical protein BME93_03375 [Methanosarcinales archaeon Met12]
MKCWTDDEINLLRKHISSSKDELLKLFQNRSWASIRKKISRVMKARKIPKWFSFDLLKDRSIEELAEERGLSPITIERIVQAGGRSVKDFRRPQDAKFELLMAGGMITPCCGCTEECRPEYCALLNEWIQALV